MPLSPAREDLLHALCQVQNHPLYTHQDILTITGCGMSDDEVRAHLESCIVGIAAYNLRQIDNLLLIDETAKPARKSARKAA